jgi:hypothetical protein
MKEQLKAGNYKEYNIDLKIKAIKISEKDEGAT